MRLDRFSRGYRHRNTVLDCVFAAGERGFRFARADAQRAAGDPKPARSGTTLVAWCVFLVCAALSQIAFKFAARQTGAFEFSAHWFALAIASGWIWVSVASHVCEFLLWMSILSRSALSSAFATSAILFIIVMAASWLLFGEPIGPSRLAGSAVILAGILLLGADAPPAPARKPAT